MVLLESTLVGESVVGEAEGEVVVGEDVGALVGETVVGEAEGEVVVGEDVGALVGESVVGEPEGEVVVGEDVGALVGEKNNARLKNDDYWKTFSKIVNNGNFDNSRNILKTPISRDSS
jgi:hypothetical protein